jgi:hypothetical protein
MMVPVAEPTGRHGLLRCVVLSLARVGDKHNIDFAIVRSDSNLRMGHQGDAF